MPKALELSDDTMDVAPPIPKAAQLARPSKAAEPKKVEVDQEPKEPLQVRWPAHEVKAMKLASIQMDFPTVSDFMLACFHAYMKDR